MIKKYSLFLFLMGFMSLSFAQKNINNYKYVVVPMQFDFLSGKDKYRLNTLTRHLFKTNGFDVYFDEELLPEDLFENRCLGMYANVKKLKSLLTIKVQIELKDCRGNLILVSDIGKSKEKEYAKGYNEAIRNAFESIAFMGYKYEPLEIEPKTETITPKKEDNRQAEVEQLKQEIEELKTEKAKLAETVKTTSIVKEEPAPKMAPPTLSNPKSPTKQLFAQPIANGFQLVDTTPKIVMKLYRTGKDDVYMVNDFQSIVYKKGDKWYMAKAAIDGVQEKELNIKF